MANSLLTINMITREAVRLFKNSNLFIQNIDTQYDPAFANDGAKIGSALRIRLPNDYVVRQGPAMQLQDTQEQYTTLTVSTQSGVDMAFSTAERTMSLDDYSERVLQPALNNLTGDVAATIMQGSEGGVSNFVSNTDNSGAIISPTSEQYLQANAILDIFGADMASRKVVNDPITDARMTTSLQGLLNPVTEITQQFRSGMMKSGLGYEKWMRDQTVIKHTTGTFSAGGTINGGGQTTASGGGNITVNAITGTFKAGDIITIDGVNSVNRTTKRTNGTLMQFVITADVITGATTLPIYPGLIPVNSVTGSSVQYQTVDASPINGAAVRLVNTAGEVYRKSIAYVRQAITMATADLVLPRKAVEEAGRASYDGVSIRILTDYLPGSDQLATRLDVLYGFLYIRPEWCCVVADKV